MRGRIAVLKDYNAAIKEVKKDSYVILEHFCDSKEENELAADGMHLWRNLNNAYCQSAMGYAEIVLLVAFMRKHCMGRFYGKP